MEIISARDFRANQTNILAKALNGGIDSSFLKGWHV